MKLLDKGIINLDEKIVLDLIKKAKDHDEDAVEQLFKVKVAKVNTISVRGKEKRMGRFSGYTASWKKAIVTLTENSKEIEFFQSL